MIKAENIIKRYGKINAVDHFSIQVNKGEMVGLFGPNGSGKTTTLQVLQALISKNKGEIEIWQYIITYFKHEEL